MPKLQYGRNIIKTNEFYIYLDYLKEPIDCFDAIDHLRNDTIQKVRSLFAVCAQSIHTQTQPNVIFS